MSEDLQEQIENTPSHDDNTAPSTVTEAEVTKEAEASAPEKTEITEKKNSFQKRINQLTTKNFESEQRAKELEHRIKDLESRKPEEVKPVVKAPIEDDFGNFDEFQVAHSEYIANNAADVAYERVKSENKVRDEESQQSARVAELKSKKATFDQNLDAKRGNFEDFEDVAYGHKFMTTNIASRIFGMEKGPEVAYHLGSNLDVAERIFTMDPIDQAVELAKIEMQVEALKPKVVSDAPDVITPLGGHEKVFEDPDQMSADQWQAWRNKDLESKGLL